MKFKLTSILIMIISISGCGSLLSVPSQYSVSPQNTQAIEIASYNLASLQEIDTKKNEYILVNKDGDVTIEDLMVFINSIQANISTTYIRVNSLEDYNAAILKELKSSQ